MTPEQRKRIERNLKRASKAGSVPSAIYERDVALLLANVEILEGLLEAERKPKTFEELRQRAALEAYQKVKPFG